MSGFLRAAGVLPESAVLTRAELEYAPDEPNPLHPKQLLGEVGGKRGQGQTSPDIAFFGELSGQSVAILTESKLTEPSFYNCSAFRAEPEELKLRDLSRCDSAFGLNKSPSGCWLRQENGRLYWDLLQGKLAAATVAPGQPCPGKVGTYQLFRQQALAEGYANAEDCRLAVSAVAYDERNTELLAAHGADGLAVGWGRRFAGKARFAAWSHQSWVKWVREHGDRERWRIWLDYVGPRYGY